MQNNSGEFFIKDIWLYIFSFLPHQDLLTAGLVCKFFNQISSDNHIWKSFLEPTLQETSKNEPSLKTLFFRSRQQKLTTFALGTIDLIFHAQVSNEGKIRSGPYRFIGPEIDWPKYIQTFKSTEISAILVAKEIVHIIKNNPKAYPKGLNQLGFKNNTVVHCLVTIADQETLDYLNKQGAHFELQNFLKMSPLDLLQIYNPTLQLASTTQAEPPGEEFHIGPS